MMKQSGCRDRDGLTLRESLFCRLILTNKGNGTQAARDAGYKGDVSNRAVELLKRPTVMRVIQRERARLMEKAELSANMVIEELKKIAFFDPRACFDAQGNMLPVPQWSDESAAAIAGFSIRKDHSPRLRFWNKLEALKLLGVYLRMWDYSEVSNDRLNEVIAAFKEGAVSEDETDKKKVN